MGSVGSSNINIRELIDLPLGSQIEVENVSGITGRPIGTSTVFTLREVTYSGEETPHKVWTGKGYSDIANNSNSLFEVFGQRQIKRR